MPKIESTLQRSLCAILDLLKSYRLTLSLLVGLGVLLLLTSWLRSSTTPVSQMPESTLRTESLKPLLLTNSLLAQSTTSRWETRWVSNSIPVKPLLVQTNRVPNLEALLRIISEVESNNKLHAVGDRGASRGPFQFQKVTWDWTSRIRRSRGLPTTTWYSGAVSAYWSKEYAKTHAQVLAKALSQELGYCSHQQVYAAWNAGIGSAIRAQGNTNKLPVRTRTKMQQFSGERFVMN